MRHSKGFTLIEVLVALVVLAAAVTVLGQTLGIASETYARLEDKTQAYQVATDKLVELQVYQQWPGTGSDSSTVERFDQQWRIETEVSEGPFPDTRRVDIEVGPRPDDGESWSVFYTLASLLGKP